MECGRCSKVLTNKSNYIAHLKIKKVCLPTKQDITRDELLSTLMERKIGEKTYECKHCDKPFSTSQGRYNHQKICSEKKNVTNSTTVINNTYNNCNINPIYNNIVVIHAIGQENKSYLTEENIKNLCLQKPQGIFELLKLKHTNEVLPENQNLRKRVHKDNYIEAFDGTKWDVHEYNTICKEVFKNIGKDILEFLDNNKDISFDDLDKSEEKRERIIHSFFDKIGIPLELYLLFDSEALSKYKETYNVDWTEFEKKRKNLFQQGKETIYHFTSKSSKT